MGGLQMRCGGTVAVTVTTRGQQGRQHRWAASGQCRAAARQPCDSASQATGSNAPHQIGRRQCLLAGLLAAAAAPVAAAPALAESPESVAARIELLQTAARQAYAERNFAAAVQALNGIIKLEPKVVQWREMRAQALVDGKNFTDALRDFDTALALLPADAAIDRARLLSGRGLAFEGLGDWPAALKDYKGALALAGPDPYVQNSVGNCHASLGEWQAARQAFLESSEGFQRATGFRQGRSTTPRLDGAVFSASNAALMLAQLGDEEGAMREMEGVARRAPGSVDMRAALAALYWRRGDEARAESEWEFACNSITTGCTKYTDPDWLLRIRRWPPIMVDYLQSFLKLRSTPAK